MVKRKIDREIIIPLTSQNKPNLHITDDRLEVGQIYTVEITRFHPVTITGLDRWPGCIIVRRSRKFFQDVEISYVSDGTIQ